MPRNDIAAIIGLVVVLWYWLIGPGRGRKSLTDPRGFLPLIGVFLITFAIVWIVLRLLNY